MITRESLEKLIDVASGKKKADLVLKNANIVDVCMGRVFKGNLAI